VIIHGSSGAESTVHAVQRTYTDGLNGQTVFTYHAQLDGPQTQLDAALRGNRGQRQQSRNPFAASFTAAPQGRAAFRWTSYGDLSTPQDSNPLGSIQSQYAVEAVESFAPLFHLLNGDLCYANYRPTSQPTIWAAFGNNVQTSAAHRPWMPCPAIMRLSSATAPKG